MKAKILPNYTDIALNNTSILDFEESTVQVLDLQTLKRTHKENNAAGEALRGIHHFQLIENVAQICESAGLNYQIEEIFAAQNKNRQFPGMSRLEDLESIYGIKSPETYILRRVFATIRIDDGQDEETTTTIALAYHQDGIQAAIGPCVKICHNQCILGPERVVYNYGKEGVTTEQVFSTIQRWLNNFFNDRETDKKIIEQMKRISMSVNDIYQLIGLLTSMRVMHDSKKAEVSSLVKTYALNQTQISQFTDRITTYIVFKGADNISLWDVYNFATEIYKPFRTEIPNLMPQNLSLMQTISEYYELI